MIKPDNKSPARGVDFSFDQTGSKEKSKRKEDPAIVIAKNARRNASKRDILGCNSDGSRFCGSPGFPIHARPIKSG